MNLKQPVSRGARALCKTGLIGLTGLVGACGGGGNESGPPDSVIASPAEIRVSGGADACVWGVGPTVFVYGGQPPYTLYNSAPLAMVLDRQYLSESGDGFQIAFTNGICLDQIPVTIEDSVGRVIAVPVTNEVGR